MIWVYDNLVPQIHRVRENIFEVKWHWWIDVLLSGYVTLSRCGFAEREEIVLNEGGIDGLKSWYKAMYFYFAVVR